MKIIVKEVFIDKYTNCVYKIGECLDFEDAERVNDLVERGLAVSVEERIEPVKKTSKRKASSKS